MNPLFHYSSIESSSHPSSYPLTVKNANIAHPTRHQNRHRCLQNRFSEALRLVQPAQRRKDLWWEIRRTALRLQSHHRPAHLRQTTRVGEEDHVPVGGLLCQQPGVSPALQGGVFRK